MTFNVKINNLEIWALVADDGRLLISFWELLLQKSVLSV